MMPALPTAPPASRRLAAFIGFIVLFTAITAGYSLVDAGRMKWQDAAWTGNRSGAAVTGFLNGADQKAVRTDRNPYPDVLPLVQRVNDGVFVAHAPLVAWLVTLGETLLPVGVFLLLCLRFPGSHAAALAVTALAASLNFLYMLEGSAGTNPWLVFMWLSILWLLATSPQAALFYAFDLSRRAGNRGTKSSPAVVRAPDRWVFLAAIFVLIVVGNGMLYPPPVLLGLLGFTLLLACGLVGIKARAGQSLPIGHTAIPSEVTQSHA